MKKLLILIFCLILSISSFSSVAFAAGDEGVKTNGTGYYIEETTFDTEIALLVNADTDTVVYSKNADKITAPASLTKIVTALVALDECDDLQKKITCSYDAVHSLDGTGSSVAGLIADETTTFEMLLYCLFLPSANDAAAVLAEHFGGGDTQKFVNKMNDYVAALGCKDTYFANPHGLDDESVVGFDSETQNRTTANDMYLIAKKALQNDTIKFMSSKYGKTMPATNKSDVRYLYNTNPLLNDVSPYYYEGAIGLKTGTTDKAGCCLISSATKDGYTFISIAMKGTYDYYYEPANLNEANTAFLMCRRMLQWAFANVKMKTLADESYVLAEAGVKYGRGSDYVGLVPANPINAVVHKDIAIDDLTVKLPDSFVAELDAPVEKGQIVTTASLMYNDVKIADVELVAVQTVKKNYLWAAFNWVESIASSKYFFVILTIIVVVILVLLRGTKNKRKKKKRLKSQINVVKDYSNLAHK